MSIGSAADYEEVFQRQMAERAGIDTRLRRKSEEDALMRRAQAAVRYMLEGFPGLAANVTEAQRERIARALAVAVVEAGR